MLDIINYFSQIVLPWITWNNLHIYEEFTHRLNSICTSWSLFESNKMANKSEAKVYFRTSNHIFRSHAIIMDKMTTGRPLYLHNEKNNFSWKVSQNLPYVLKLGVWWNLVPDRGGAEVDWNFPNLNGGLCVLQVAFTERKFQISVGHNFILHTRTHTRIRLLLLL